MNKIIGIDPGSENTGIVVIENRKIRQGYNVPNAEVLDLIHKEYLLSTDLKIIIEAMRPYNMRITDGIIETLEFIGWIKGKLKETGHPFEMIPRHQVKQWVFLQFKSIAVPAIEKKIILAANRKDKECIAAGKPYVRRNSSPTFVYVDDRIVANAMRKHWNIKKPARPGERAAYGLKDHSWQALGLVSYYMASNGLKINKK